MAANVLEHGTGAINIDGCRVGTESTLGKASKTALGLINDDAWQPSEVMAGSACGRWPANLIHDGSDEVTELFPISKDGVAVQQNRDGEVHNKIYGDRRVLKTEDVGYGGSGSAARFFYTAKASKDDRDKGNTHPTVKPTDLMAYLCRLVTPPGGIVLDPFMGSGTTGKAALSEGFSFIGIERDADYYAICESRFNGAQIGLPLAV